MAEGWVSIHRQLNDHWLWKEKPFSKGQAWIDILIRVNHKPASVPIGNQIVNIQEGETIWSVLDMSLKWGWSRTKTENFLKLLEKEQQINTKKTTKYTVVSVLNWSSYQDNRTEKDNKKASKEQQKSINKASKEQQKSTNNNEDNDNNEKNDNKDNTTSRFTPPTENEISVYCLERKNNVSASKFHDFYESKGWMVGKNKMKDWKAAIRTWESKEPKKTESIALDMSDNDTVNAMLRGRL